jgi:hypothetical protein
MRLRSTAPLNFSLNWSRLLRASDVSGGWPLGGEPQKYQKIRHARAATINHGAYFNFDRIFSPLPSSR